MLEAFLETLTTICGCCSITKEHCETIKRKCQNGALNEEDLEWLRKQSENTRKEISALELQLAQIKTYGLKVISGEENE